MQVIFKANSHEISVVHNGRDSNKLGVTNDGQHATLQIGTVETMWLGRVFKQDLLSFARGITNHLYVAGLGKSYPETVKDFDGTVFGIASMLEVVYQN